MENPQKNVVVPSFEELVQKGVDRGELTVFEERLAERFGAEKGAELVGLLRAAIIAECDATPSEISLRSILHAYTSTASPMGYLLSQPPDAEADRKAAHVFTEQLNRIRVEAEARIRAHAPGGPEPS